MIAAFRLSLVVLFVALAVPAFAQSSPKAELSGTLVLDLSPQDATEQQAAITYRALAQTLARATDLEPFLWRDKLGLSGKQKHPLLSCHGMGNTPCVRRFGQNAGVRYLVYGELRGLDDLILLTLELMDVKSGRILESVRRQVSDPRQLVSQTDEAACYLTRLYGCVRPLPGAAPALLTAVGGKAAPVEAPKSGHDIDSVMRESAEREKLARSKELDDDVKPAPKRTEKAPEKAVAKPTPKPVESAAKDEETAQEEPQQESEEKPVVQPKAQPVKLVAEKAPKRPLNTFEKAGWSLMAISAASLGGGIGCSLLADKAYKDYTKAETRDKAQSAKTKTKTFMYTSYALYGLSAAGLAGGITLIVLGGRQDGLPKASTQGSDEESPAAKPQASFSVMPQIAPDGFGLTLGAAF